MHLQILGKDNFVRDNIVCLVKILLLEMKV